MNKTTSCRHGLQALTCEFCAINRYPKVTYPFLPVPEDALRGVKSHLHAVYTALVKSIRLGVYDPAIRWLAAETGKGERQVKRDLRDLCGLGLIKRIFRRISRWRNQSNVYEIPAMRVGVTKDMEKHKNSLTTTTPTLSRGVSNSSSEPSSWLRTHLETRFAKDRADSAWRRDLYQRKASFLEKIKGWARPDPVDPAEVARRQEEYKRSDQECFDKHTENLMKLMAKWG